MHLQENNNGMKGWNDHVAEDIFFFLWLGLCVEKVTKEWFLHVMVDGNIIVLLIATFWECSAKVIEKLYDVKMEG